MEAVRGAILRNTATTLSVHVSDAVPVLHAFQKKSKSGIATPQPDVELSEKRWKAVLARYGLSGRS
jgi:phage-related protein